jgi:DNA repair photolyase
MSNWHYPSFSHNIPPIDLLCGSTASFDDGSGCAHRCDYCGAVVGSVGMPKRCKDLYDMEEVINKLKGKKNVDI